MRLALAFAVLTAVPANAETQYLALLIDRMGQADLSLDDLTAGLKDDGFAVKVMTSRGPDFLSDQFADPFYYYVLAEVQFSAANSPVVTVECSRIGMANLPHILDGTFLLGGQDTQLSPGAEIEAVVEFAPGAVAQLWCRAKVRLRGNPIMRPDDLATMPDVAEVDSVLRNRFTTLAQHTQPNDIVLGRAVVLGETLFVGYNPDPLAFGKASRVIYDHWSADLDHEIDLISHLPPSGS